MRKILLAATVAGFAAIALPAQTQAFSFFGSSGFGGSGSGGFNFMSMGAPTSTSFGGFGGSTGGGGSSGIGGGYFANIAAGLVNNAKRSTRFTLCATIPIIGKSCDDGSPSPFDLGGLF